MRKYTAETIEPIAQKVVELLLAMMEQANHIGDTEQELRGRRQMVGQTSLQMLLEQAG